MARNLGFLTAYGLEDIYDFIGESKINLKIKEYESRPTMGIRLENFVGAYYSFTEGEDKGPLWVMQTFLSSWFRNDFDLPLFFFLYEKSKKFTEENYLRDEPFKSMWQKHIMDIERMKDWWISNFSIEAYNVKKLNPYWVEYHYFTQEIVKALSKYQSDLNVSKILKEIFEGYLSNSDKLTERLKKDKVMWPVNGLGSDIYSKMEQYYFEINNKEKLKEIWEKAEKQGWRVAFFYKEEDDEENDE